MVHTLKQLGTKAMAALALGLSAWASGGAQRLLSLPGEAQGVSADGCTVVGSYQSSAQWHAYRWTVQGGVQDLGSLPDYPNMYALGVSADGAVVVGQARNVRGIERAFRWSLQDGLQELPALGPFNWASGISADGSIIVGSASGIGGSTRAVLWRDGVMQDLNVGSWSYAYGVSADGRVIVGWNSVEAIRWENGHTQYLGRLPGYDRSRAYSVSDDGRVVVGYAAGSDLSGQIHRAFRWSAETGMQNLGVLGQFGRNSFAWDVTADGTVVVGNSDSSAFRWTVQRGIEDLNETYADLLPSGLRFGVAHAISPDGRYIVGSFWYAWAFLLDTWRTGDTNGDGCIDDSDLIAVLFAFGTPGTGYTRHEDINKDGIVDDADLLEVLFNFGQGC